LAFNFFFAFFLL